MRKYITKPLVAEGSRLTIRQHVYKQVLTNRYLHHNLLILGTTILAGIFSYLLHPFLAHLMSVQEYGQVAVLISLSLVLTTPTQIVTTVATKYTSSLSTTDDGAQLNDFIRRLTSMLFVIGVAFTAVFIAISGSIASFFHLHSQQELIILGFIFVFMFVTPLNMGVLQGTQRFDWFAVLTLLPAFLRLALAVGLVLAGLSVNGVMLAILLATLLPYLVSFQPLRTVLSGPRRSIGSLRFLWSYSLLASVAAGCMVFLGSSDTVLTSHFLNPRDVGFYAALATLGRTIVFVTNSVTTVMFPRIASLHEQGKSYMSTVVQALLGTIFLSGTVELLFLLTSSQLTKLLFGQAFLPIAGLLAVYGLAMVLFSISMVIINFFLAVGNRSFVYVVLLACVLQTSLIVWQHMTIAQIVYDVLMTNAVFVLALLAAFAFYSRKTSVYLKEL